MEKTSFRSGVFAPYAEILLGKEAMQHDSVSYIVRNVQIKGEGIPDETQRYTVEFRPQTPSSFVSLTRLGVLAGINVEQKPEPPPSKDVSQESIPLPQPALPEEYALATSQAMRAKIASETLFSLREDLMNLLTGKVASALNNEGAYQETTRFLKAQVVALEALFFGTSEKEMIYKTIDLEPFLEDTEHIIAYFSSHKGIERAFSSESKAISCYYKVLMSQPQLPQEEEEKRNRRLDGVVYNVPGLAEVRIVLPNGVSYTKELPITQLGNQVLLNKEINRNKSDAVAITFDPNTGQLLAINELSQY